MSKRPLPSPGRGRHRATESTGPVGHLVTILPTTTAGPTVGDPNGERVVVEPFLWSMQVASYLSVRDFNQRQSPFVDFTTIDPSQDCDLQLTLEMRDSQGQPLKAVEHFQGVSHDNKTIPMAVIGDYSSSISTMIAELAGIYRLPILSPGSTSRRLDNQLLFPTFGRTTPTNEGDAHALLAYWSSMGVEVGAVLYVENAYGTPFADDLRTIAYQYGIEVRLMGYTPETVADSVQRLVSISQDVNYFFGIFGNENGFWRDVVVELLRSGFLEEDMSWILAETCAEAVGTEVYRGDFDYDEDYQFHLDWARGLNGTGCLLLRPPPGALDLMNQEWAELGSYNVEWEDYKSHHVPYLDVPKVDDLEFLEDEESGVSTFALLAYDAVMSLGIAACQNQNELSADQLVDALRTIQFEGASGTVSFDETTLSRQWEAMEYQILNILAEPVDDNEHSAYIHGPEAFILQPLSAEIQTVRPFLYPTWTTIPPPISKVAEEMNLLPPGLLAVCWSLAGISILMSAALGGWTVVNRNRQVVREAQPLFLCLLCFGAFLMACGIIPLGFQEPMSQSTLDVGCMITPWLWATGFTLAFAALYSKIHRINRVFQKAQAFHRVRIKAVDVLKPLITLMALNILSLTVWTILSPIGWDRQVTRTDEFGRPLESYGSCNLESTLTKTMLSTTLVINAAALVLSNYESYKARNLPSRFNESLYVGLTNFILLEVAAISAPVFVLIQGDPASLVLVATLVMFVMILALLMPSFGPKILLDHTSQRPMLRLNRFVSAYPTARNPLGLFRALSIRVPRRASTTLKSSMPPAVTANQGSPAVATRAESPTGPSSPRAGRQRARVSFSAHDIDRGTQDTSRSTLYADSSRELNSKQPPLLEEEEEDVESN